MGTLTLTPYFPTTKRKKNTENYCVKNTQYAQNRRATLQVTYLIMHKEKGILEFQAVLVMRLVIFIILSSSSKRDGI